MTKPNMFADAKREDWMTDELLDKLRELARDGKVHCAQAQEFARENNIALDKIRPMLDVLHLKVGNCQLGCF